LVHDCCGQAAPEQHVVLRDGGKFNQLAQLSPLTNIRNLRDGNAPAVVSYFEIQPS
jgi:hypothetical protein